MKNHQETLAAARAWLANQRNADVRTLARDTLVSLDAMLRALQGGTARDALFDAREALAKYVNRETEHDNGTLDVKMTPAGGVTLVRAGQHFTITDEELEQVREVINVRKREVRKRQRREGTRTGTVHDPVRWAGEDV